MGQALRVGAVLQGRVRREGGRMRVNVRLTDTSNGMLLWSNSYEREVRDVFAVQDELTRDIVGALRITYAGARAVPSSRPAATRNPAAHDLYLRGRYFLSLRGGGVARSIGYFQQAIALDSGYANAWAQLGTALALVPVFGFVPRESVIPRAHGALAMALRLDSTSAEAHTGLGLALMFDGDYPRAEAAFRRAIALDSGFALPYRPIMSTLAMLGRLPEAVALGRKGVDLDPLQPVTLSVFAYALALSRQYPEALVMSRRAVELDSLSPLALPALAGALLLNGDSAGARAAARRANRVPNTSAPIAWVMGSTGTRAEIDSLARVLAAEREVNAFAMTSLAFLWLGARDTSRALEALEQGTARREPVAFQSAFSNAVYDPIRESERFAAVVRQYGLDVRQFRGRAP